MRSQISWGSKCQDAKGDFCGGLVMGNDLAEGPYGLAGLQVSGREEEGKVRGESSWPMREPEG